MGNPAPPYISAEQCEEVLTPADVVSTVRTVLEWDAEGSIHWPKPRSLNIAPDRWGNDYHMKAAVLEQIPVAGLRIVSHPLDESSPQCTRLILLVDPATALPLALVDESWSYVQRTVGSIALAAHTAANADSSTMAIVGAGRMARTSVDYYADLFDLKEVRVASRTPARRDALVADLRASFDFDIRTCESAEEAVRGADLVLTATSSDQAVIDASWIAEGATVACVGTAEPGRDFAQNADLFLVDSPEQLGKELVEVFGPGADEWVSASVGDVVSGAHPGRTDRAQRALIITEGMASQDVALAHLAYQRLLVG
jgi:alanine dehydrogenase